MEKVYFDKESNQKDPQFPVPIIYRFNSFNSFKGYNLNFGFGRIL